ncbi:class I SAM-dependent methyltransferase [Candidatus Daviesbacteria bacterium]|nr:class I SAM-dependent methyltransferase [Candidatus Daviesbacteria bacterium]
MKPKLNKEEKLTLNTYKKIARQWAREHSDNIWSKEIAIFKKYLPKGKILEIGSGDGRDAKQLIKMGYQYIGTDISKELLKVAKMNNPKAKFYNQSVYELDFPDNYFDGFWASAVLLHIPKVRINEALKRIQYVTKNKGLGFITLKRGEGEKIVEEVTETGMKYKRLFSYYLLDEFKKILKKNGFDIIKSSQKRMGKTTWLIYFVRAIKRDKKLELF